VEEIGEGRGGRREWEGGAVRAFRGGVNDEVSGGQ